MPATLTDAPAPAPAARKPSAPTGLSPSRAIEFRQCPLRFRLSAIDKITRPRSAAAVTGIVFHAVFEDLYGLDPAERTLAAAHEFVATVWEKLAEEPEIAESAVDLADAVTVTKLLQAVHTLIDKQFRIENPSTVVVVARETWLHATLPSGLRLRGVVDRLDDIGAGLRVVDYKTGAFPSSEDDQNNAMFQLKFYGLSLLYARKPRGIPAELVLQYPNSKHGTLTLAVPDPAQLEGFARILDSLWKAIEKAVATGDFRPRKSWKCKRLCDFRDLCPLFGGTPPPYPLPITAAPARR